jgi:hypothetical protein
MAILEPVFRVRIVYKSGYTHDFECTEFTVKPGEILWNSAKPSIRPVKLGVDDVAAIWQLGVRYRLKLWR